MKQSYKLLLLFPVSVICLSCLKQNEPPVIQSLTANPRVIYTSDETGLNCKAIDPDGDELTFLWTSANGSFATAVDAAVITWNAPQEPGIYAITVTVSDGKHTIEKTVNIEVVQTAIVNGYVYFSGTRIPVSGANIQIEEENYITNEDGRFLLKTGIGLHSYTAKKEGFINKEGDFTVGAGNSAIKIELTSEKYTNKISGTIKNIYDSYPVEGAGIIVLNPNESDSELETITDSYGTFEIVWVPKGDRQIKIVHPYYNTAVRDLYVGDNDLNINIEIECRTPEIETVSKNVLAADTLVLEGRINLNCNQNMVTGFCYSESPNPTVNDNIIEVSNETGILKKEISDEDVELLKIYHYKAFVQTDFETVYGDEYTFLLGILVDYRNNDTRYYVTVKIGDQVWMAENLAYLPKINLPPEKSTTEPNYFVYGYNGTNLNKAKETENYRVYGVLYNWPAAISACPNGWHLPDNDEWEQLAQFVSDQKGGYSNRENYWYNVGLHLKATSRWLGKGAGTDEFGFSALPGGYYNGDKFFNLENNGYWWSATELDGTNAFYRYLNYNTTSYYRDKNIKNLGFCVRCLKDK